MNDVRQKGHKNGQDEALKKQDFQKATKLQCREKKPEGECDWGSQSH